MTKTPLPSAVVLISAVPGLPYTKGTTITDPEVISHIYAENLQRCVVKVESGFAERHMPKAEA